MYLNGQQLFPSGDRATGDWLKQSEEGAAHLVDGVARLFGGLVNLFSPRPQSPSGTKPAVSRGHAHSDRDHGSKSEKTSLLAPSIDSEPKGSSAPPSPRGDSYGSF